MTGCSSYFLIVSPPSPNTIPCMQASMLPGRPEVRSDSNSRTQTPNPRPEVGPSGLPSGVQVDVGSLSTYLWLVGNGGMGYNYNLQLLLLPFFHSLLTKGRDWGRRGRATPHSPSVFARSSPASLRKAKSQAGKP